MDIRYPAPDRWGRMHIAGDRNRRRPLGQPHTSREAGRIGGWALFALLALAFVIGLARA